MIQNITNDTNSALSQSQTCEKTEVNDDFIKMLTDKFSNDDVRDPYQDSLGKPISDLCNVSAILGVEVEGKNISMSDIRTSVKNDFSSFSKMFGAALDEAGISRSPNFEIKSDYSGKLYIDSDHPEKESIEKILNETPNIRDSFKRMSANSSLLAAAKRHEEFSREYAIDPQAAVQKYSHLFNTDSCDVFSIFVSDDELEPSLKSYGEDVDWEALVNPKNNEFKAL